MIWGWWEHLPPNQHAFFLIITPLLLFFTDLLIKNGFNISIESAGGDMCLAAVGLDISQLILFISDNSNYNLSSLLIILVILHIFLWIFALRLISLRMYPASYKLRIGTSYFLGLISFYSSFGTIYQYMLS